MAYNIDQRVKGLTESKHLRKTKQGNLTRLKTNLKNQPISKYNFYSVFLNKRKMFLSLDGVFGFAKKGRVYA